MPDNETINNSLVPIHNTGLIKVGNIIKITDKVLKEYSERALAVFYKSVIIGEQEWMVENLNIDHFRNGDPIPEAKTTEEWIKAGKERKPAWCYYDNNPENGKIYGKLYNWYAVNDPRGLAPEGWHIPSIEKWDQLINYLGGEEIIGDKIKTKNDLYFYGTGNNESGFSAIPNGFRNKNGDFYSIRNYGGLWSSTDFDNLNAWHFDLNAFSRIHKGNSLNESGFSVRCIKDNNKGIVKDTKDAKFYYDSGVKKYENKNYDDAIEDFNKAIGIDPNYVSAYSYRGVAKDDLKDYEGAISDYNKAIEIDPKYAFFICFKAPIAYNNRGVAKDNLKDYEGAIVDYTIAIEINPNYADAYYNRGNTKRNLNDYKGALIDYTKTIEINSNHLKAYENRSEVKREIGDIEGAENDLKKYNELKEK